MERVAGAEEGGCEQDLVGFAEAECLGVGGHYFAILLGAFGAHCGLGRRKRFRSSRRR